MEKLHELSGGNDDGANPLNLAAPVSYRPTAKLFKLKYDTVQNIVLKEEENDPLPSDPTEKFVIYRAASRLAMAANKPPPDIRILQEKCQEHPSIPFAGRKKRRRK